MNNKEIKKIGIISLFGYSNYGNRLQLYAVQKIYEMLGYDAEIIRYNLPIVRDRFTQRVRTVLYHFIHCRSFLQNYILESSRERSFQKHSKKHNNESRQYVNPNYISQEFIDKYSHFSVGSDQVWGPFMHMISDFIFLGFVAKEKRIAFSPSFGVDFLPENYHGIYTEGLLGFAQISVREKSGAVLVKNLTGVNPTVLSDPTFFLGKSHWEDFSEIHRHKPTEPFIVTYFLGEEPSYLENFLRDLEKRFRIVRLNSKSDGKYYSVNPSEWVDYIKDAKLILTDSFHAVVFSIIMHRPFAVYPRVSGDKMHTRIENVLTKFNLENRLGIVNNYPSLFEVDYSHVDNIILEERENTYNFLCSILDVSRK